MSGARERGGLAAPAVPSSAYDEHYYLHAADGHEQFLAGDGFAGRYHFALSQLRVPAGGTLVDVGCGRGELACLAALEGAGRAVGVEYADAALELARECARRSGVSERTEFIAADARRLPLEDGCADAVALLDVIEHLSGSEQTDAIAECRRVLRRGGRFLLHTFPNRLIYTTTYRTLRRLWPGGGDWPEQPRSDKEVEMHVGELTAAETRRLLAGAGFREVEVTHTPWVFADHVPARGAKRAVRALAAFPPTRHLGRASVLATATG